MKKALVLSAVLSLSSLCFAGGKSYSVTFSEATTVSGVKLAAGEYKVKVDGANAIFTDRKAKSVSTPVKVETATKKFDVTSIDTSKDGSGVRVEAIKIGGSTTKLEFAR